MALAQSSVSVMLPISDPERAHMYYADKLGLEYQGKNEEQSLLFGLGGGAQLVLLPRPDEKPSPSTAMSFEVTGIEDEVQQLEQRGVEFQDYDLPDLHTENHICVLGAEKAAWMLDPDGNVLCIHETLR